MSDSQRHELEGALGTVDPKRLARAFRATIRILSLHAALPAALTLPTAAEQRAALEPVFQLATKLSVSLGELDLESVVRLGDHGWSLDEGKTLERGLLVLARAACRALGDLSGRAGRRGRSRDAVRLSTLHQLAALYRQYAADPNNRRELAAFLRVAMQIARTPVPRSDEKLLALLASRE